MCQNLILNIACKNNTLETSYVFGFLDNPQTTKYSAILFTSSPKVPINKEVILKAENTHPQIATSKIRFSSIKTNKTKT